ncbi:MAG TPA: TolC family protein [Labilithrix sp.]|nr:TolC family protein [Labilithrix sp.]
MREPQRLPFAAIASIIVACASCLATSPAGAEEPARRVEALPGAGPVLTRDGAVERLKRENLALLAGRHRLSQARADIIAAGVWQNPNLTVNGLFLTHGAITGGNQEVSMSIDQVIPIAGQVGLRKDLARGLLGAEERAYAASVWDAIGDAKIAYVDLQRAQARWRVVRSGMADLAKVETIVTERAAAGANAAYDRIRVGVERSKLEGRLAQAEAELLGARATLAQAVGASIDARTVTVEDSLEEAGDPPGATQIDALVKRALVSRPDVDSARLRADAGELRVAVLKRQIIPSPDVSIGYARYLDVPDASGRSGGAVLAGVSFPIPILDHGQGTVDRGHAVAAEDRVRKDAVELAVRREVERATGAMAVRVGTWRRFRDTTALDIDRLRSIGELAYREGRATILELLDAYASYVDAQERRVELQSQALKAALDLERALGPARSN